MVETFHYRVVCEHRLSACAWFIYIDQTECTFQPTIRIIIQDKSFRSWKWNNPSTKNKLNRWNKFCYRKSSTIIDNVNFELQNRGLRSRIFTFGKIPIKSKLDIVKCKDYIFFDLQRATTISIRLFNIKISSSIKLSIRLSGKCLSFANVFLTTVQTWNQVCEMSRCLSQQNKMNRTYFDKII